MAPSRPPACLSKCLLLCAAVAAASSSLPRAAHAQSDAARAALLAREAEDLLAQGKTTEACSKMQESYDLDPRGSTALDLAVCREKEGKTGRAYRMYGVALEAARSEKRNDRVQTASAGRNRLVLSVPRLTVEVPAKSLVAGMLVTVNGEEVPVKEYGKPWEVDPGQLVVQAQAPGRKRWETTLKISNREKKAVTVPALEVDDSPPPPPPAPKPAATPKPPPEPGEPPPPEPAPEPRGPARTEHDDNRLVIDIGAFGGFLFHDIERGELSELVGASYLYQSSTVGLTIAECGNTTDIQGAGDCEATFESSAGASVGGTLFVGWALLERFHVGARGFFAPRFPDGWFLAGGPGFSVRAAGPFWVGATFLLGASSHTAALSSAEGSVPPEAQDLNGGAEVVDIPLDTLDFTEGDVGSGLFLGGALELSLSLLGPSPHAFANTGDPSWEPLSGALMASLWPAIVFTQEGYALQIPAGISYRFH